MKQRLKTLIAAVLSLWLVSDAAAFPTQITQTTPSWVPGNATYAFDFANRRTWGNIPVTYGSGNTLSQCSPTLWCFQGSSVASNTLYGQWKDGILRPVGKSSDSNVPRITDYGLWIEDGPSSGTNFALWSRDFTQSGTWTLSSVSVTKTGIVGADGISGNGNQLTATAANATALQTITNGGALYASSIGVANTIATGGTGYTSGTVTLSGGTCTTTPTWTATASGGIVTAVTPSTVGVCSVVPANPVSVTGGGGSGLTINAAFIKVTASAWIKCITCTGPIYLTADNVTFTDISSQLKTSRYIQVRVPSVTRAGNTAGIKIGNSGDVIAVDFFQLESDDQATSPIVTTTASSTRGPENVFIGTNGSNFNAGLQMVNNTQANTPASYRFVYSGNFSTLKTHALMATDTRWIIGSGTAGAAAINTSITGQGTSINTSNADVSGLYLNTAGTGTVNRLVISVDGSGAKTCLNGVLTRQSTPTYAANTNAGTHINLLNNGSNILPTKGYIAEFDAWTRVLTDDECMRFSTQ